MTKNVARLFRSADARSELGGRLARFNVRDKQKASTIVLKNCTIEHRMLVDKLELASNFANVIIYTGRLTEPERLMGLTAHKSGMLFYLRLGPDIELAFFYA
jgi:hypothetical protein